MMSNYPFDPDPEVDTLIRKDLCNLAIKYMDQIIDLSKDLDVGNHDKLLDTILRIRGNLNALERVSESLHRTYDE